MQDCADLLVNNFGQYYDGDHGHVLYTWPERQSDINIVASKIDILSKLLLLAGWDSVVIRYTYAPGDVCQPVSHQD